MIESNSVGNVPKQFDPDRPSHVATVRDPATGKLGTVDAKGKFTPLEGYGADLNRAGEAAPAEGSEGG